MKNKAIAVGLMILFGAGLLMAQSAGTDTWSSKPANGPCQIYPPENYPNRQWYCFVTVFDSEGQGDASTLSIYVTVQPDNTFTNGLISKSPLYGNADSFTSSNFTGTFTPDPSSVSNGTFTGTFSGTTTNGVAFTGQNTEVIGQGKYCQRYTCHPANGRVVADSGSVTFQ